MEKDSEMNKKSGMASDEDGSTRRKRKGLSLPISIAHRHEHDDDGNDVLLPQKKRAKASNYSISGVIEDQNSWNRKYELLRSWKQENGHCQVPFSVMVNSSALGCWVANQREYYKNFIVESSGKRMITQERIDKLNSIGFEWKYETLCSFTKAEDEAWNQKFELLQNFQRDNGHTRVPFGFIEKKAALGCWVAKQRACYNNFMEEKSAGKNTMTQERIDKLNSIGFEWSCEKVAPFSANDKTQGEKVAPSAKSRK